MTDEKGIKHRQETDCERDLGIIIDSKLDWAHQISNATSKAYSAFGTLKRSFKYWTQHTFKILFNTYVRPHLEYCAPVWNPHTLTAINILESVQRKASKIVPTIRSLPYDKRLIALKHNTLAHRRSRGDQIMFYKIYNGLNQVNLMNPISHCPSLDLTGPAGNIRGPAHRITKLQISTIAVRENFFSNRVVETWNKLPENVIKSTTKKKKKVDIPEH